MRLSDRLSWLAVLLWATSITLLQSTLARVPGVGPWIPDLGLILFVALVDRVRHGEVMRLALFLAAARLSCSLAPVSAVLAGFLGLGLFARGLKHAIEISGGLTRTLFAGLGAVALGSWLLLVEEARDPLRDWTLLELHTGALTGLWRAGATTAMLAAVLGPTFGRLPGLRSLGRVPW